MLLSAVKQALALQHRVAPLLLSSAGVPIARAAHTRSHGHSHSHGASGDAAANDVITPGTGLIEVREYTLKPDGVKDFMQLVDSTGDLRKRLLPFLGMFTCDTGGCLHKVTHLYYYKDLAQRETVRAEAYKDPAWLDFLAKGRQHVQYQTSKIMVEATRVYDALRVPATANYASPARPGDGKHKAVYELREYQLHPGYGSVPKLIERFAVGLPEKVAADHEGQLVFFGYTDVGLLNNVVELWRYPSAQACTRARQAARKVDSWRATIEQVTPSVQQFQTSLLHPVAVSPWQ